MGKIRGPEAFAVTAFSVALIGTVGFGIVRAWPYPSSDLQAQQSMANAAWAMVWLTGVGAIVGSLSLYLIARTLIEARRSAAAGEESVREAKANTAATERIGRAQVKAYLSIREVALMYETTGLRLEVVVYNAGQSPARHMHVDVTCPDVPGYWNALDGVRFEGAWREAMATNELLPVDFEATVPPPRPGTYYFAVVDVDVEFTDVFGGADTFRRSFSLEVSPGVRMGTRYVLRHYTHDDYAPNRPRRQLLLK